MAICSTDETLTMYCNWPKPLIMEVERMFLAILKYGWIRLYERTNPNLSNLSLPLHICPLLSLPMWCASLFCWFDSSLRTNNQEKRVGCIGKPAARNQLKTQSNFMEIGKTKGCNVDTRMGCSNPVEGCRELKGFLFSLNGGGRKGAKEAHHPDVQKILETSPE